MPSFWNTEPKVPLYNDSQPVQQSDSYIISTETSTGKSRLRSVLVTLGAISIIAVIIGGVVTAYLLAKKTTDQVARAVSTRRDMIDAYLEEESGGGTSTFSSLASPVQAAYENPFDEETGYTNPFDDEAGNPFE